ncbi:MAG: hypothetical protein RL213_444 [Bacteroidota bacterium]|jgi:uncharacterized protein (TIGR01777 family)
MRVLITGATGFLGRKIAARLAASGHTVYGLSRTPVSDPSFSASFLWDPDKEQFDSRCLADTDAIVHLAGAGIADKRWTAARKRELLLSRTTSTTFLARQLSRHTHHVKSVVAASASGYYGDSGASIVTEQHPPGSGFLAETCVAWEAANHQLAVPGRRLVLLRIGFVIDRSEGALPVMARPVRWMAGAPYGSGRQFLSWIDSHDLARLFEFALANDSLSGVYNAVSPEPVTNREFLTAIGRVLHRPVWPFAVPAFVFRTLLGEQSELVLGGQNVSAEKVLASGFSFEFPALDAALKHHLL